ncbi:hypothetical protein [Mucilaginibacter agri]|uniref:Uncharacterized protein n=1 Tax=Mucilaginibacter agri TaxID=2695265 RepID=A0A965ZH15_9SPHI|nr:hypothetical protein [Mucilaginibacter agri]NCD70860.1 hypothetical protein [Mucilaginibacter agri]
MNIKYLILLFVALTAFSEAKSQTTPATAERQLTDSICNCMVRTDLSKVKNKQEAMGVFTECFSKYQSLLVATAEERKVDFEDDAAMHAIGADIGKNLMKMNCSSFMKLSVIMASDKAEEVPVRTTQGKLIRIDNKGFNYLVVVDENKKEYSFLWLHQFQGSEKFVNGVGVNLGKKVSITWQDTEVYLPAAKGYYNVKEITALSIF